MHCFAFVITILNSMDFGNMNGIEVLHHITVPDIDTLNAYFVVIMETNIGKNSCPDNNTIHWYQT